MCTETKWGWLVFAPLPFQSLSPPDRSLTRLVSPEPQALLASLSIVLELQVCAATAAFFTQLQCSNSSLHPHTASPPDHWATSLAHKICWHCFYCSIYTWFPMCTSFKQNLEWTAKYEKFKLLLSLQILHKRYKNLNWWEWNQLFINTMPRSQTIGTFLFPSAVLCLESDYLRGLPLPCGIFFIQGWYF